MPFSHIAETRIREALARGEFDDLPNAGQPLDLEDYFRTPSDLRMAYSILKSANCAPVEVELMKEVARLKQEIDGATDPVERERLTRSFTEHQTRLAVTLERRRPGER